MKLLLTLIVAALLVPESVQARVIKIYSYNGTSRRQPTKQPCVDSLPLGCVNFKTTQTWNVGSQVWSDVVMATGCKKSTYNSGTVNSYNADCRQSEEGYGDLFSWQMVDTYKDRLCPDGWRVPTRSDYADLVTILDNNDANYFLNTWGAALGGHCAPNGALVAQGEEASYWSQSNHALNDGRGACFTTTVEPLQFSLDNCSGEKRLGFAVRCVK